MRTLSMTRSNCGLSCLCPAVTSTARGRPLPSVTRCSLVPKPPRLLPRAWSAGSEGGGFFFRRPGRGPRRPDVGAVDAEQLGVDEPGLVELQLEPLDDAVEQAALAQRGEPVIDGLPRPEPLGQVTPGGPGVEPPEDAVEHQPVVLPLPAGLGRTRREELGQQRPLVVGQFVSLHAPLEATTTTCDSPDRALASAIQGTDGRASVAFARFARRVLDEWYADAERVVFVLDNLSTHAPAAFYEAFEPAEARRLVERVEWHYTPKHGSWLNVAELELSVLARQCLDRRIPDTDTLRRELAAWGRGRDAAGGRGGWPVPPPGPRTP